MGGLKKDLVPSLWARQRSYRYPIGKTTKFFRYLWPVVNIKYIKSVASSINYDFVLVLRVMIGNQPAYSIFREYLVHYEYWLILLLSMFMLSFIVLLMCGVFKWKRICAGFCCYCLFMYVLPLGVMLSRGDSWYLIYLFNTATHFVCLSQTKTWNRRDFWCVQWLEVRVQWFEVRGQWLEGRGNCSICWYS
jgi:hypothetical protein